MFGFAYGSTQLIYAGWAVVLFGVYLAGSSLYRFVRYRKTSFYSYVGVVDVLVSLYIIGMGFKVGMIGHWFLRWYVADIGFPAMESFVIFTPILLYVSRSDWFRKLEPLDRYERVLHYRRNTLVVALCISYVYELAAGGLYALRPELPAYMVGKTDPWDLVCYTLGGGLGLAYYRVVGRRLQRERELVRAFAAEQRAAQQPEKRNQPTHKSRADRRR